MKPTAIILAVYFALGSVFPKTDFQQLVYLPQLIGHFQEHALEASANGSIASFFEFLQEHFVNPDSHEHDDNSHQNLPLKTIQSGIDFFFKNTGEVSQPSINGHFSPTPLFIKTLISSDSLESLFRPPISI